MFRIVLDAEDSADEVSESALNEAIRILSVDDRDVSADERAALETRLEAWVAGVEFLVAGSRADLEEQLALEAREQGKSGASRDFKEGVMAFAQKRAAQFGGR